MNDKEEYAIGVQKGNAALLEKFNAAITKIKTNGTFDAIVAKYFA
ncbi:MAG: transporter substrate-binding domain-containing protein [Clostridia bacterium]